MKPRKKIPKPRWIHLSVTGDCPARCDNDYGNKTVRIKGFPINAVKVEQLARWFTAAAAWLRQEEEKK